MQKKIDWSKILKTVLNILIFAAWCYWVYSIYDASKGIMKYKTIGEVPPKYLLQLLGSIFMLFGISDLAKRELKKKEEEKREGWRNLVITKLRQLELNAKYNR